MTGSPSSFSRCCRAHAYSWLQNASLANSENRLLALSKFMICAQRRPRANFLNTAPWNGVPSLASNDAWPCALPPRALRALGPPCAPEHPLAEESDMLRKPIATCLVAAMLAVVPVMAQTPAPGPTPPTPQPGVPGGSAGGPAQTTAPGTESSQGKVIGTPQDPSTTKEQTGVSLVPISYVVLVVLGVSGGGVYILYRRRRRG